MLRSVGALPRPTNPGSWAEPEVEVAFKLLDAYFVVMDEFDQPLCVLLFEHSNSKFDNMNKPTSLVHFSRLEF